MTPSTTIAPYIVGRSAALLRLRELIVRFARTDIPVLIHGQTGTGKELVARAIHECSGRSGSLVAVNVAAVADTMVEAALFGHVRGAFTGATSDSPGYLAEANGGTIFLDEIGGLSAAAQVKLLRALENGTFRPVGASRDRVSAFRVVSATNEDLEGLTEANRFRTDLLHRLGGVVLVVPSLVERRDDIPDLVEHFRAEFAGDARPYSFSTGAIRRLSEHDWPGNVRQLRHVVRRACVFSEGAEVTTDAVFRALGGAVAANSGTATHGFATRRLTDLLDRCGWDTVQAAAELGVHRATIYRRMERLGVIAPVQGGDTQSHAQAHRPGAGEPRPMEEGAR